MTTQPSFGQRFWQRVRRIGLEIYAFFTTPWVIKNCLSMTLTILGVFLLIFWWMKCYTNHGQSIQVPNYVGMSFRDAAKKARSRDFSVAVSDSIYVPGKAPGEVIAQNPKPESQVKEGRTIYFTVAKNNPDIIKLPDLASGDDYELYSRKLTRLGLKPRIAARVPSGRLSPNTIVAVIYRGDTITNRIARGFPVEMGGTVDFVVSDEANMNVSVPDCVCQTYDAAKFLIQTANLSIGSIVKDAGVVDEKNAYVWRQMPAYDPNGRMRVGEQIDLYLTQERPQGCDDDR